MHKSTIGQLAVHVGSGVTPRGGSESYSNEGVIFIRSQNVRSEGLDLHDVAYIDLKTHESMRRSEVFACDVLLNITGASIGRCCVVPAGIGAANVNQHVCAIRLPSPTEPDASFLAHVLASHIGQSQIDRLNAGGNREGLNYQQLRAFSVPWPSEAERLWIAAVLDTIDDAIQKTEQIIAKLQQVKQGLLHDLLTRGIDDNGELRDPDRHPEQFQDSPLGRIPKGWRVGGLEEIGATDRQPILTGPFGSHLCAADFVDSGVPLLRIGNVQWGSMDLDDLLYIRPSKALELERYRVDIGDLLFARQGATTGRNALVDERTRAAIINYHIIRVAVDRTKCNPTYLYFVFNSPVVQRQVNREKGKSTREGVNTATLTGFLMPLPSIGEQDAMSELIEEYDERLRREHASLAKLRITKSGLSDDLLTGRVRTTSLPEFSA